MLRSRASVHNPSMTSVKKKNDDHGAMVMYNGATIQKSNFNSKRYQAIYESPRFMEQNGFNFNQSRNMESSMSENESSLHESKSIEISAI